MISVSASSNIGIALKETISFLEEKGGCRELIEKAGFPEIKIGEGKSPAYCVWADNTIVLNETLFQKKAGQIYVDVLQSLIFEYANLSQREKFSDLVGRIKKLTPGEFVEEYERLEHGSALIAKAILRKCIEIKDWNNCTMVFVSDKFEPHYLFQQISGHSRAIWERYADRFEKGACYLETCASLSSEEKKLVLDLFSIRLHTVDREPSISDQAKKDWAVIKGELLNHRFKGFDLRLRIQEMEKSFGD